MVRSGEEFGPFLGTRVGQSSLRRPKELSLSDSKIESPLAAALESPVDENHAELWALKSPRIRMSS